MESLANQFKHELKDMTKEQAADFLTELLECINSGYSTEEAYALVTDLPWTTGQQIH